MRITPLLLATSLVIATGCGAPADKLVGSWHGSTQIYRPPTGNVSLDQKLSAIKTTAEYSLDLRKNKTYTEKVAKDTIEGKWTFQGGALTLTPTKVNGNDPAKERKEFDDMSARLQIKLPIPEGTDGPKVASVAEDFSKITLPSIGTTVELTRKKS